MTKDDTTDDHKYKEEITDVNFDRIVADNGDKLKRWVKDSSNVENWKLAVLFGSGILSPTLPYTILIGYGAYKLLTQNIVEFEEGRHYETKRIKYEEVDKEEE